MKQFSSYYHDSDSPDHPAIKCRLRKPCRACGSKQGVITAVDRTTGNPHHFRLECGDCGRFQRWVSPRELGKGGFGHA